MAAWYVIFCNQSIVTVFTVLSQPMYGMPQPNTYGQYGFGGYGATPTAGAPGMPSPTGTAGALTMGAGAGVGAADPTAAAGQAAQGQWAGADPNSYYSNYWGGKCTVYD